MFGNLSSLTFMMACTSALIASLGCLLCIYLLKPIAIRIGLLDSPDPQGEGRKQHLQPVPPIGGVAIFFGFSLALLSFPISLRPCRWLIAGSVILLLMGIVDDCRNLSAKLRLWGQIAVALLLVMGGTILVTLGVAWPGVPLFLGILAIPCTVLFVVINLNAMNMIDGQDGLAGGIALSQAGWLWYCAWALQAKSELYLLNTLCAALIVFLAFNMRFPWQKHARIFMGDAGSTCIAFILSGIAISLSQKTPTLISPLFLLWILALPLFDLFNVVLHRIKVGRSVVTAGRDHVHHILSLRGMKTGLSTFVLCSLSITLGGIGFLLNYFSVPEGVQLVLFLIVLWGYLHLIRLGRCQKSVQLELESC